MNQIKKQKNCCFISSLNNNILLSINNETLFNEISFGDKNLYLNFYIRNNKIFYYNDSKIFEYVDNEFQLKFEKKEYSTIIKTSEDCYICYKRVSRKEDLISFFEKGNLKWEIITSDFYNNISPNYFTVFERFIENKFSIFNNSNNKLWSFEFPSGFSIYIKPYLVSNILYFTAYDQFQKNQLVTGLDLETGAIVWQHMYDVTSANKVISAPVFNEKDQLIYALGPIYQVFNPKTGEIVLEKIFDECKNYNLLVDAQAIYDNKLWFVSGGGKNTKFGYVNIDTHQLEFIQDLPHEEYEVFDIPVFHEDKLYLRGKHQNNLYVFE